MRGKLIAETVFDPPEDARPIYAIRLLYQLVKEIHEKANEVHAMPLGPLWLAVIVHVEVPDDDNDPKEPKSERAFWWEPEDESESA